MNYSLRVAEQNEEDFKRLMGLLTRFASEHKFGSRVGAEPDYEKAIPTVVRTMECMTWVAEDDAGNIIGSLGLMKNAPWFTSAQHYGDTWFYVLPEWRKSGVGKSLIEKAKEFAETADAPVTLGIFNSEDTESKIKLLQRAGLKLIGGIFYIGE